MLKTFNIDPVLCDGKRQEVKFEVNVVCPICHVASDPFSVGGHYHDKDFSRRVVLNCFCTSCRCFYIVAINASKPLVSNDWYYGTQRVYPYIHSATTFSEGIANLSPTFCSTYNQAEKAEELNLSEIAGIGYRRSIEFLVKDYVIHKSPGCEEDVEKELLGASIKRIEDPRIKTLCERATWIGNDETHYVRRHESLDISDMKRFINATLSYIDSELTFEEALSIERK